MSVGRLADRRTVFQVKRNELPSSSTLLPSYQKNIRFDFPFNIIDSEGQSLFFNASSSSQKEDWISNIRAAMGIKQAQSISFMGLLYVDILGAVMII